MGNQDTSKVIPLFPQSHSRPPGAMSAHRTQAIHCGRRSTTTSSHIAGGSKPSSPCPPLPGGMALRQVTPYPRRKPAATR